MWEGERLNLICVIKVGLLILYLFWYKDEIFLVDEESINLIVEELIEKDDG